MKKQKCTIKGYGKDSIPGLIRGHGKCQYHYDVGQFGKDWADHCERERKKRDALADQFDSEG